MYIWFFKHSDGTDQPAQKSRLIWAHIVQELHGSKLHASFPVLPLTGD